MSSFTLNCLLFYRHSLPVVEFCRQTEIVSTLSDSTKHRILCLCKHKILRLCKHRILCSWMCFHKHRILCLWILCFVSIFLQKYQNFEYISPEFYADFCPNWIFNRIISLGPSQELSTHAHAIFQKYSSLF